MLLPLPAFPSAAPTDLTARLLYHWQISNMAITNLHAQSARDGHRTLLFAALCLQELVNYMSFYAPNAFLPHFAHSKMGLSISEIGYVYAISPLAAVISVFIFGAFCALLLNTSLENL
jgi:hypothetical protein